MSNGYLSIIIPNKNEPDIANMIRSVKLMYPMADIVLVDDSEGRGKGYTLRKGLETAEGDIIAFLDADCDIHVGEIHNLLPYLCYYDVVIGYKDLKKLPPRRRLVSFGYRLLVRFLFRNLRIKDSQTGLKIWKRDKIPYYETDDFSFDVEMLLKARKAKLRIKEVPINCRIYSKVTFTSILKTFLGTLKIWVKDRRGLY